MKITASILLLVAAMVSPIAALANYKSTKSDVQAIIEAEAIEQGVPVSLAMAVARVESSFNPKALSHAGARGVMQIMPATAEKELGVSRYDLYDANTNIEAGIRFLKHLIDTYDNRVDIALSHYNGGSAVRHNGRLRVIPATRQYVKDVKRWAAHYAYLDERSHTPSKFDFAQFEVPRSNVAMASRNDRASAALDDFSPGGRLYKPKATEVSQRQVNTWVTTIDSERQRLVNNLQSLVHHNLSRDLADTRQSR